MFQGESYIGQFTDMMSEGFIYIDGQGKIQIYNQKAKEIFGILYNEGIGHPEGSIQKGDIIIIADNCLGKDDGGLEPRDLEVIGVGSGQLKSGDAFIAMGVFGDKVSSKPCCKVGRPSHLNQRLTLHTSLKGINIHGEIDFQHAMITIVVGEQPFTMKYLYAIGHMVVLDGMTHRVKFYQANGYTARGESVHDVLQGKVYRAKGKDAEAFEVVGRDIFEIHRDSPTIKEFYEAATGKEIRYTNKFTEINGRPTICTLLPVNQDGKRVGAVLKVEDISEIRKVIRERDEALLHLEQAERKLREEELVSKLFPEVIGESEEIHEAKRMAYRASRSHSTVLLLGESGTGKNLLAKAIHHASARREKPFILVNCASIPENLLESELFGYEGGAFTGAKKDGKAGMFELAHGGTIFLDEIGEIPPVIQVKLLQVLQSKSFYRVGGDKQITVDVRIIVATNKNLEEEMVKGAFRGDLFYRINVFPICMPSLRERKQDIQLLVQQMLPKICQRIPCETKRISGEALQLLKAYDWPGNVRELENVLERAVNLAEGNLILSSHLLIPARQTSLEGQRDVEISPLRVLLEIEEKRAIHRALCHFEGNRQAAMKALQIGKTCFYDKLKKYNLG